MDVWKAAAERARTHGDVLVLAAGQPSTPAPAPVLRATELAIQSELLGYTETFGILAIREAIAEHHRETYGYQVEPDDVVVTTGSSGAFSLIFLAAFDPGDTVVVARPGYPPIATRSRRWAAGYWSWTAAPRPDSSPPSPCSRPCRSRLPVWWWPVPPIPPAP